MILLDHGDLSEILKWATHQKKPVSTFIYPESFFRLTPQFLEKERESESECWATGGSAVFKRSLLILPQSSWSKSGFLLSGIFIRWTAAAYVSTDATHLPHSTSVWIEPAKRTRATESELLRFGRVGDSVAEPLLYRHHLICSRYVGLPRSECEMSTFMKICIQKLFFAASASLPQLR